MSNVPTPQNFNSLVPPIPGGKAKVVFQSDTNIPRNISAYADTATTGGVQIITGTSYTTVVSDQGTLLVFTNASPISVTLDSTLPPNFIASVLALGGPVTLTPTTGLINGAASVTVPGGSGGWLYFNGTNWYFIVSAAAGVTSVFGRTGAVVAVAGDYGPTLGGTGQTAWVKGDLLVGSGTNTTALLAPGTDGFVLTADSTQTDGVKWAAAASPTQPFDVIFNPNIVLGSGAIYDIAVFARQVIFPGNFSGAVGHCRINPGSTQTITINKNGSGVGTISITSGGVFTFTSTAGASVTYAIGDYMSFTAQAGADAGMLLQITLAGTR
jgi:hypothetical protein